MKQFEKSFTQQEAIPAQGIKDAVAVLESGRIHRYNTGPGELAETSLLEQEYADYQRARFCLAVTSGGQAMQIALRAAGLRPGDKILANAYTLAPVPGAIHACGGVPVFVEIGQDWLTDITDLRAKAASSRAKFFMLSHMRGHIADMDAILAICEEFGITLVEDCAHTMGAKWQGKRSGNFGRVACFSTQTYKHMNSGEGGFLTTDDEELAARAVILSGSYMLYERHGAAPGDDVFRRIRLDTPNCSARLDNLRATILRAQLTQLDANCERWNARYQALEEGLRGRTSVEVVERLQCEAYVGSSFQFHARVPDIPALVAACGARGVELKWFGGAEPVAFTSRYDSWQYFGTVDPLPKTLETLATTVDLRVPLTFSVEDCSDIAEIIAEEAARLAA
jgi:dTDP-4-amino-4,6-dideoxygalactose transaminase